MTRVFQGLLRPKVSVATGNRASLTPLTNPTKTSPRVFDGRTKTPDQLPPLGGLPFSAPVPSWWEAAAALDRSTSRPSPGVWGAAEAQLNHQALNHEAGWKLLG